MYQIDNSTAAVSQPAATAAGSAGFFTDGNPATSTPATIVPAEWLNAVMMEMANVVTGAGLTLSKPTYTQVRDAIKRLVQNQVVLTDTGSANAYAAANSPALVVGTWTNGVTQQVKITNANTGASTYAPDGLTAIPIYGLGLQPLQGGELYAGGTAILMKQTITGVNSGNPIAVLLECSGGAQQVAPATKSQHAAQLSQVVGVVGSVRNASMSVTTASSTATWSADEVVVETALSGIPYRIGHVDLSINLATTGAGGMDTGSAPASGFVALYAIYNPSNGAKTLLATNATSSAAPQIYGGANMPAGYTASALVSVWPTNASGQFVVGVQIDRYVSLTATVQLNTSTQQASYTALTVTTGVPLNAKSVSGQLLIQTTVSSAMASSVSGSSAGTNEWFSSIQNAVSLNIGFSRIPLLTPQTLYYTASVGSGTMTFKLSTTGYEF